MIKLPILILALIIYVGGYGQEQITYKVEKQGNYEGTITNVLSWESPVSVISELPTFNKTKSFITTYNNEKGENTELGLPFKNGYVINDFNINDRYFRLARRKEKKERKVTYSLCEFESTGKYIGVKKLYEYDYNKYSDFSQTLMIKSKNEKYYAIVDNYDEDKKSEDFVTRIHIYDNEFNELRYSELIKSGQENQRTMDMLDVEISDIGEVFLSYIIYKTGNEKKKAKKKKIPTYKHKLLRITADEQKIWYELPNDDYFTYGAGIFLNSNNKPQITSIILNKANWDSYGKGIASFTFDLENEEVHSNFHLFNETDIKRFGTWKKSKKGLKPKSNFNDQYIVDSGKIHICIERYYQPTRKTYNSKYTTSVLESALVVTITNDGQVYDYFHVPKYFEHDYFRGRSLLMLNEGKPALLYNDLYSNQNIELKNYKKFKGYNYFGIGPSLCVLAYQDDGGNIIRQQLKETEKGYADTRTYYEDNGNLSVLLNSDLSQFTVTDLNILKFYPK